MVLIAVLIQRKREVRQDGFSRGSKAEYPLDFPANRRKQLGAQVSDWRNQDDMFGCDSVQRFKVRRFKGSRFSLATGRGAVNQQSNRLRNNEKANIEYRTRNNEYRIKVFYHYYY